MVLPLAALMMGAGTGMQMIGQEQQSSAQDVALARLRYAMRMNAQGGEADRATSDAALGNLGEQWRGSAETAVDDMSAENQRGAFATGQNDLAQRTQGALAQAGDPTADASQAAGQNMAFLNAKTQQGITNNRMTEALQKVLSNQAGMTGMNTNYRTSMLDKGDRDSQIQNRINDILKLQNYATGIRQAALGKAQSQHGFDQARAASTGSGMMYLGALMGGAAGLANQGGQQGTQVSGGDWMQGLFGSYGNPANGVDAGNPNNDNQV